MSLETNLKNLTTRMATEAKALRTLVNGNAGDLSALSTAAKGNLVAALNELRAALVALPAPGSIINDASSATGTTWSSDKIAGEITTALSALTQGAPGALDTLDELAAALGDDANFAGTITTALANRLRVDAAQALTPAQKAQGLANLGGIAAADVGDVTTNFVALFEAGLA